MAEFGKIEDFLSKKYSLGIIRELLTSPTGMGFNAVLKKVPGITPRILSLRLKELEQAKIIQKNLVLGTKPRIEYVALPKAQGLKKAISELEKWGLVNLPEKKAN